MTPFLGAVRLSRLTDETTSPERQTGHIHDAATRERGEIIHLAEDLDVSASKFHPMERPSLGPWLTDPEKLTSYKGLIYWRLDRFVRSASDFQDMTRWAREHDKLLISATETMLRFDPDARGIDKTISDIIHAIAVAFAEMESYNLSVRVTDAKAHMRTQKRWASEPFAFGHEPYRDGTTWKLRLSDRTMPIRREVEDRIIAIPTTGETIPDIARDLNSRGIPSPKNWALILRGKTAKLRDIEWNRNGIYGMFEGDAALGYKMHKGVPVLDDTTGMPVVFWEPVTTEGRLREVRRVLSSLRKRGGGAVKWPYWGRVLCFDCDSPMHRQRSTRGPYTSLYLSCPEARKHRKVRRCQSRLIPLGEAEEVMAGYFLRTVGDHRVTEMRYREGSDHTAEISRAEGALTQLVASLATVESSRARAVIDQQIQALSSRLSTLESASDEPFGWETVELDETYRDVWERSTPMERAAILERAGVVLRMRRLPDGGVEVEAEHGREV